MALTGEVDILAATTFVLALGFGLSAAEAGKRALASLYADCNDTLASCVAGWHSWQAELKQLMADVPGSRDLYRVSVSVLRIHESKRFPGGIFASLSIPWALIRGVMLSVATHLVSADALALVRLGLCAANDPRVANTVKVIDALLKVDTPFGPFWHRYNEDGYGEHEDGSPFDGTGTGRGWPLLTGERGHYELAAGDEQQADYLLRAMAALAAESGLIPEQVWDVGNIPTKELFWVALPALPCRWCGHILSILTCAAR